MNPLYFAAYSRVSLDEQRKGISPEDQIHRIHAWTRQQSIPFALAEYEGADGTLHPAEFYEDYTGFEYERPEMDVIRELAKLGLINAVIILRTDRFARDEAVFMLLERYFKKHGVRLFSVEEGEFTPGTVNRYVAAFQRARAEDDAQTTKKRMRDARHAYLKSGVPQGQGLAVYGYVKQGSKRDVCYVIVEEQAAVVRLIYHLFLIERLPVIQIAADLMEMGIPCPSVAKGIAHPNVSGKWSRRTIRQILENPCYRGMLIGYKTYSADGQTHSATPEEQVSIDVPPIVDEQTWAQAQYLLETTKESWLRRHTTRQYLLSGMISCMCGHGMVASSGKGAHSDERYYYYRCNSYSRIHSRPDCGNKKVRAEDIEYTVWDFVERLSQDPKTTMALYAEHQEANEAALEETELRLAAIDELLEENKQEKKRLNQMFQKNRCDNDYFESEWQRLEGEQEALKRERQKAERLFQKQSATRGQLAILESIGEELDEEGEADFEKKRRTLERLRIHVTVEGVDEGGTRWLVIEVLGHSRRVGLKNSSARSGRTAEPGRPPRARRYAGAENGRPVHPDRPPRPRRRTRGPG